MSFWCLQYFQKNELEILISSLGLTEDSTYYLVCFSSWIIKLHSISLKRLEISGFFAEKADTTCDFDQTDVQCEM